ncbi:MAG: histidine kinase [Gemmatimonadaceae bacterium]|nr:histidine kinase [Gemmatimonadaceae bacterium]
MWQRHWAGRLRAAAWYVAAWTPLVLLYAVLIGASARIGAADAIVAAFNTVLWAALLGIVVLWIARHWEWPSPPTARFFLVHIGMALLYAGLWNLCIVLSVRAGVGSWQETMQQVSAWLHWQTFEGALIYAALCGVAWARASAARTRDQEARVAHVEAQRVRAELEALRGRLDPHFLFNTLHSVTVLIQHDPVSATQAVERLSALLRYVLDMRQGGREEVSLSDEVAFTEAYLALEALRFGDRLRVERDISPEALTRSVPSFVLQSLVENAVKHGIAPRASGGTVRLAGRISNQLLVLDVSDDGPGLTTGAETRGFGVGLDALRQRLAALYGDAARVDVRSAPTTGFAVSVSLPLRAVS